MYLKLYNGLSAIAWSLVLYFTLEDVEGYSNLDPNSIYVRKASEGTPHAYLVRLQLVNAFFEISHSLLGIVPSPIPTLLLQFAARLMITSGVSYKLPTSPGNFSLAYAVLSSAWSLAEVIRYGFYLVKELRAKTGSIPYALLWLRYSAFIVLYPAGLFSESYVVYSSLETAKGTYYYWFLVFALTAYIPGFLTLYSYMFKQRGKVLGKGKRKVT